MIKHHRELLGDRDPMRRQQRLSWCGHRSSPKLLLALLLLCSASTARASPVEDIEVLVHTVMVDGRLDFPLEELRERAIQLRADLRDWRTEHRQEPEGTLALAKITWLLDRLQPHVATTDNDIHGSQENQLAMQQLKVIAAESPNTAVVHFWLAQLSAGPVVRKIDGHLTARPIDLAGAIEAAQRAWELDNSQPQYRDALAAFLAEDFRDDDALRLLSDHDGGQTPLATLIQDLKAIPLPRTAVLLEKDSRRFAEDQLARGRISDAISVRARVYLLRGDAQQFEVLCREQWPGFRLLTGRDTVEGPAWRSHAMQVLLLGGGDPRPIANLDQLDVAAMDGISLTLIELRNPPKAQRQQSPAGATLPVDLGETYVYLYILNDRTIH